jgi:hypothetical protein
MRSCSYDSLAAHPSEAATKIKHTQIAHYQEYHLRGADRQPLRPEP